MTEVNIPCSFSFIVTLEDDVVLSEAEKILKGFRTQKYLIIIIDAATTDNS